MRFHQKSGVERKTRSAYCLGNQPNSSRRLLVQIQVLLSLQLPASDRLDLDSLEPLVLQAGRECMKQALISATRQYEEQVLAQPCPYCGSSPLFLKSEGTDKRIVLTLFGRVQLPLRRVRCHNDECKHRFRAAEGLIKCLGTGNVTAHLIVCPASQPHGANQGPLGAWGA